MKKLFAFLVFNFIVLGNYAQVIYKKVVHYDKFDDVIKLEERKTLITQTDSTFIIEEKGKVPVIYYILNQSKEGTLGSKDEIVNLVNDVYGYQTTWCVVKYDQVEEYRNAYWDAVFNSDNPDNGIGKLASFWLFATRRVVTTKYTGTYQNEYFWLRDEDNQDKLGKNVSRIIYIDN